MGNGVILSTNDNVYNEKVEFEKFKEKLKQAKIVSYDVSENIIMYFSIEKDDNGEYWLTLINPTEEQNGIELVQAQDLFFLYNHKNLKMYGEI